MAFWRRVREWIIGLLFLALLVGTVGAPSAQLYFALQNLKFINSDRGLRGPPLGDQIWSSLRFSVDGAIIGIAGAGLFWLSTLVAGPERGNARSRRQKVCELGSLPLCGCVCIVATALELISIKNKQRFLPLLGDNIEGTPTWPIDTHSRQTFWNIADEYFAAPDGITLRNASNEGGPPEPFSAELGSYHFLVEYRVQIIATTCLFFLGLGLIGTVMLDLSDRFQRQSFLSRLGYNLSTWLGVICILSVAGPIFLVFEFFEKVAPWTRYHRAYVAKVTERPVSRLRPIMHRLHEVVFSAGWRIRHAPSISATRAKSRVAPDLEMGMTKATPAGSPIMNICKYDLAIVMSQQMHYTDIASLSQTCRAWHDCLFPPGVDLREQQSRLESYACKDHSFPYRRECWSCLSIVCPDCCDSNVKIDQDMSMDHLTRCYPYCKDCFRTFAKGRIRRGGCKSTKHRTLTVSVCWPCRKDTREPFLWKGARKWGFRLRQRDLTLRCCGKCSEPMQRDGARFWVCRKSDCEHECRSSAHANWIDPDEEPKPRKLVRVTEREFTGEDALPEERLEQILRRQFSSR